jgi:mannose-1-phosphate guanylyltransferase
MKAVILVGGEGTRLRPLTLSRPKPMQPVANRPFLEHVLTSLRRYDVTEIVLSMCYLPGVIQEYFGDGSAFGVRLAYVIEREALGTAGAVKYVQEQGYLDEREPFFVLNGDILTDLDLQAMLAFHRVHRAVGTIALTPVEDVRAYGLVETDTSRRVRRFIEKPKTLEGITTNLINAGTYILDPSVLHLAPSGQFYQFEQGLFPTLLAEGKALFGYPDTSYWLDIGTPEKYKIANIDMLRGLVHGQINGEQRDERIWVGAGCEIDPTAELIGPVVLGNGCIIGPGARLIGPVVLGDGCQVGPEVQMERAVLWEQVAVGQPTNSPASVQPQARPVNGGNGQRGPNPGQSPSGTLLAKTDQTIIRDCIIGAHSTISPGCQVHGAIIADHCTVETGNMLAGGLKLWPRRTLLAQTITF